MVTRRDFVLGAAAAGALLHSRFGLAKAAHPAAVRRKILVDNSARLHGF